MKSLEVLLQELINKVSPAEVRLGIPRYAAIREVADVELSFRTRGWDEGFCCKSIRGVVEDALHSLEDAQDGDSDPVIPSWYRVSRMQRQVVNQTLKQRAAEHMARAAEANIASRTTASAAEYAMADAFEAALDALMFDNADNDGEVLPQERLEPREPEPQTDQPVTPDEGKAPSQGERKKKLSSAVKELKSANRRRARKRCGGTPDDVADNGASVGCASIRPPD
ncbi:MAG: hypothetical protein DRI90_19165 [Deltaproteobacteria bacterium]|nr:MAG: hypothetical protein DRI90_19165 [Deltaproteobacteria bacterium]